MSVTARVLSVGRSRREHFDKSAPTALVDVLVQVPLSEARRIVGAFEPAKASSPPAADCRCIARPVVEALAGELGS